MNFLVIACRTMCGASTLVACLALAGCAASADFSDLARGYNEAASQSNDELLLLNILRASHRSPLQFTAVQSVTGSNQANAGLSLGIMPSGRSAGLTAGAMQSTNLTDAILDTKEFYSGMTASVPSTIINNIFRDSPSNGLLSELFFDRITISTPKVWNCEKHPHDHLCERTFHNNPRNLRDYALFQYVLQQLFAAGLSTEEVRKPLKLKADREIEESRFRKTDQVEVPAEVHFCFKTASTSPPLTFNPASGTQCGSTGHEVNRPESGREAATFGGTLQTSFSEGIMSIVYQEDLRGCSKNWKTPVGRSPRFDDRNEDPDSSNEAIVESFCAMQGQMVEVALPIRSPIRMIEFLGSAASADLRGDPPLIAETADGAGLSCAVIPTNCIPLFVVRRGTAENAITTRYRGEIYSVPDDESGGNSRLLLSVLRQLIALSTASKDLPQPSVLTVVP